MESDFGFKMEECFLKEDSTYRKACHRLLEKVQVLISQNIIFIIYQDKGHFIDSI